MYFSKNPSEFLIQTHFYITIIYYERKPSIPHPTITNNNIALVRIHIQMSCKHNNLNNKNEFHTAKIVLIWLLVIKQLLINCFYYLLTD